MRIKLLSIGVTLLSCVAAGFSQGNSKMNLAPASTSGLKQTILTSGSSEVKPVNPSEIRTLSSTFTCVDTLRYPQVKEQILGSNTFYYGFEVWESDDESVSQTFLNSSTMEITGIEFFGARSTHALSAASLTVQASIYSVNASYAPTTLLGSGTINITSTAHGYRYVTFVNPVTVTGNYAVVLTPTNANGILDLYINDEVGGQSYDELFTHFYSSYSSYPNPNNWNTIPVFTSGYNFEPLVAPIVSYSINTAGTVAPLTACLGDQITFTNTSVFPDKANRMVNYQAFNKYFGISANDSTYVWDLDWETNPSSANDLVWSDNTTYTYLSAGSYNPELYTLGGFWASCVDFTTFNVTINPLDDASFSFANSSVCAGSANVTPTSIATAGGTFTSTTGLVFADASTGEIDVAGSTAGTYVVTYTTAGSCPRSSTQSFTISNAQDASFTYTDNSYCAKGTVVPTVTGVTGTFTVTPAGLSINASTGEINLTNSTAGNYTVTNTVAATSTCAGATENFAVVIETQPTATITLSGTTLEAQETGVTYQWINCAGNTPVAGETAQTFTPAVSGSYAVIVTNGNCSETSACEAVTIVGLEDNGIEMVAIYPNPAEHTITISGLKVSNAVVSILDINGRVLTSKVTSSPTLELSVSDLAAGVYLVKIQSETVNGVKRIIKK